jgi:hypothetical protein
MKTLLVSALALGAMTSVAFAGAPTQLTATQMDAVTAGQNQVARGVVAANAIVQVDARDLDVCAICSRTRQ